MSGPDRDRLLAGLTPGWRRVAEEALAAADRAPDPALLEAARPLLRAGVRTLRRWVGSLGVAGPDALMAALLAAPSGEAVERWAGADSGGQTGDAAEEREAREELPAPAVRDASLETVERASVLLGVLRDLALIYEGDSAASRFWWLTPATTLGGREAARRSTPCSRRASGRSGAPVCWRRWRSGWRAMAVVPPPPDGGWLPSAGEAT